MLTLKVTHVYFWKTKPVLCVWFLTSRAKVPEVESGLEPFPVGKSHFVDNFVKLLLRVSRTNRNNNFSYQIPTHNEKTRLKYGFCIGFGMKDLYCRNRMMNFMCSLYCCRYIESVSGHSQLGFRAATDLDQTDCNMWNTPSNCYFKGLENGWSSVN